MDILVLIGRILFVLIFLNSAMGHLTQTKAMAGYARSKGVPAPEAVVFGSGVLMLVGALSVLLGVWADLGALLLVVFLIPTALTVHPFWKETDPGVRQNEMLHFLKDIALAGAALMLCGLFAIAGGDLGLTWTGPLFDQD
ncbi:DoxX family protein [Streptomyces sp. SBT349]|uniref:DoxX family protein n=1 Tax=Streptomyces sp. SBT349 TaxID=1580539 RepID=UPI00066DFF6B|nr:DoxX family protein [Streptomyces sp. SBT349]